MAKMSKIFKKMQVKYRSCQKPTLIIVKIVKNTFNQGTKIPNCVLIRKMTVKTCLFDLQLSEIIFLMKKCQKHHSQIAKMFKIF